MKRLISLQNVTFRVGRNTILPDTNWQINESEHWAILGPNGAGKSTLVKALWGGTATREGKIDYHFINNQKENLYEQLRKHIGYISFELHLQMVKQERKLAEAGEYRGAIHEFTTAKEIIGGSEKKREEIVTLLTIKHLLDKDIITLSTGETRKVLIARALVKDPKILILDEPFDGLDVTSREMLKEVLSQIVNKLKLSLILVTHRVEEVIPEITHVLMIKNGEVIKRGKREEILTNDNINTLYEHTKTNRKLDPTTSSKSKSNELIRMEHVSVSYGDKQVLNNFSWKVNAGEKWAILGPNGSGKSTILKLISGDHPHAYANDIWLFGKKRGSGESIWDIKKRIGLVSADIQLNYLRNSTGIDVIVSGYFDSFGLYQTASQEQIEAANILADKLNICQLLDKSYIDCSNGQKRMLILARALIKQPELLILDEPTHGLDYANRKHILAIIDELTRSEITLIMVTHHKEEINTYFTNILSYENYQFVPKEQDV